MDTRQLLEWLVYFEAAVAIASILLLFATLAVRRLLRARYEEPMSRARSVLQAVIAGKAIGPAEHRQIRRLPHRLQVRLFADVAVHLSGESRARVSNFGREFELVDTAVRLCSSRSWHQRLRGARLCTLLGVGHGAVPRLLHDPERVVRAEAVSWAGENPTNEVISTLVGFLATPGHVGGYTLRDALLRIGAPLVPELVRALETLEGEAAIPALDVAIGIASPHFSSVAERLSHDAVAGVRSRAATLLGAVGGAEAIERLLELLDDPEGSVQAAAVTALGRLNSWKSAPRIGRMLRSPHWIVRSAAAVTLRRLGGPGHLILQRSLEDADAFAADMAQQVLDLPAGVVEAEAWG